MFGLDRFRMSSRDDVSLAGAGLAGAVPMPIISTTKPSGYRPAPIQVEPRIEPPVRVESIQVEQTPAYSAPAVYTPAATPEAPTGEFSATSFSSPVAVPAQPQPDITAIAPGREALIYLNLVGEGLECSAGRCVQKTLGATTTGLRTSCRQASSGSLRLVKW